MNRRSILSASATIALGLHLFGITAGSTARAAEIKLLCAVALQPGMVALIPDFEKSSGHKVTVAYGNAGAIADRFQKGEAADLVINAAPLMPRAGKRYAQTFGAPSATLDLPAGSGQFLVKYPVISTRIQSIRAS